MTLESSLIAIVKEYESSFKDKVFSVEQPTYDLLMDIFNVTPDIKAGNRQFWGRELGMCWQRLVIAVCRDKCSDFIPAFRVGNDEPCDLIVGKYAIDTKYRMGSGDSGTLKKFKSYGQLLRTNYSLEPVMLFVRDDNLKSAIDACKAGTWKIYTSNDTFEFIKGLTGFDIKEWLTVNKGRFNIKIEI
jgi:hypothetical protein